MQWMKCVNTLSSAPWVFHLCSSCIPLCMGLFCCGLCALVYFHLQQHWPCSVLVSPGPASWRDSALYQIRTLVYTAVEPRHHKRQHFSTVLSSLYERKSLLEREEFVLVSKCRALVFPRHVTGVCSRRCCHWQQAAPTVTLSWTHVVEVKCFSSAFSHRLII